jgi:hypothetical protein
VTLNRRPQIWPELVHTAPDYAHPQYDRRAVAPAGRVEQNGRNRTHYCGAYWGYGFHEDGVRSGLRVARASGRNSEHAAVAPSTRECWSSPAAAAGARLPLQHLGMLYLDLDELPAVLDAAPAVVGPPAGAGPSSGPPTTSAAATVPLATPVRDEIEPPRGERPTGPIRLLTHPRYWGWCFNPVSFYYVFAEDGQTLRWVVADVTNTPWHERHAYVLGPAEAVDWRSGWRPTSRKVFHVSPFMTLDMEYRWLLRRPASSSAGRHRQPRRRGPALRAVLSLERRPLDRHHLGRLLFRYPWLTLQGGGRHPLAGPQALAQGRALPTPSRQPGATLAMTTSRDDLARPIPSAWQRLCRRLLLRALGSLRAGRVTLHDADGTWTIGHPDADPSLTVRLEVSDPAFYPAALLEQSAGVGRAYMEGWWEADDPVALMRILARDEVALRRWTGPTLGLLGPWHRLALWRRRNHRAGARRNIAAHYDLGDDFFAAFLDPTLTYSCAVFASPEQDLQPRPSRTSWSASAASSTSAPPTTCWRSAPAGAASRCTPRGITVAA